MRVGIPGDWCRVDDCQNEVICDSPWCETHFDACMDALLAVAIEARKAAAVYVQR